MGQVQQPGGFPDTRWSLILRLRTPTGADSAFRALEELCRIYWQPLYVYLRRTGQDVESAKDSVQGFLAHFLSKNGFQRVAPAHGRFRHFILAALRNYQASEARKQAAVKRGGEVDMVPLDVQQAEEVFQAQGAERLSPETAFDRRWAQMIWTRALGQLRQEQVARGKEQHFDLLKHCLAGESGQKHQEVAARLGLPTPAVALALHRLRRRLRELVLAELAQTVGTDGDLAEELKHFLSIWSK